MLKEPKRECVQALRKGLSVLLGLDQNQKQWS